jgi:hypothetical protein
VAVEPGAGTAGRGGTGGRARGAGAVQVLGEGRRRAFVRRKIGRNKEVSFKKTYFRRPGLAAENKVLFSTVVSVAAENKSLFSTAMFWPPKMTVAFVVQAQC